MTIQELSERANRNEEMPDGLQLHDSLLFLSLRHVYQQFHDGQIDLDTAQREKNRLVYQYDIWKRRADDYLEAARRYQQVTIATEGIRTDLRCQIRDGVPAEKIVQTARKMIDKWDGLWSYANGG